jgi:hypothetical protein
MQTGWLTQSSGALNVRPGLRHVCVGARQGQLTGSGIRVCATQRPWFFEMVME